MILYTFTSYARGAYWKLTTTTTNSVNVGIGRTCKISGRVSLDHTSCEVFCKFRKYSLRVPGSLFFLRTESSWISWRGCHFRELDCWYVADQKVEVNTTNGYKHSPMMCQLHWESWRNARRTRRQAYAIQVMLTLSCSDILDILFHEMKWYGGHASNVLKDTT
jgi:hypothetical protein